jgi:hypothetical protein
MIFLLYLSIPIVIDPTETNEIEIGIQNATHGNKPATVLQLQASSNFVGVCSRVVDLFQSPELAFTMPNAASQQQMIVS